MLGERAAPVLARVVFTVATPALLVTTVAHADLHLLLSRTAVVTWTSTVVVALVAVLVLRFGVATVRPPTSRSARWRRRT